MSGKFSYTEVFHMMLPDEIQQANTALDIQIEADKKALKS